MNAAEKKAARDAAIRAGNEAEAEEQRKKEEASQAGETEAPQAVVDPNPPDVAESFLSKMPEPDATQQSAKAHPEWEEFLQWKRSRELQADAALDALSGQMPTFMQQAAGLTAPGDVDPKQTARIAALQMEVLEIDLITKRVLLEQTVEANTVYKQTKEQRIRAAEQAQTILNQAHRTQLQIEAGCDHATGGFGMEDIYQGDNKPSIILMDLPVPGRKYLLCYRCLKAVVTPDPNLRFTDLERYLTEQADYKEFLKLFRKSLSRPMGGPVFKFEDQGRPVDPVIK